MSESSSARGSSMIGLPGQPLSLEDLPPPNTKRWVSRRKAQVVVAVRSGLLSLEEACARYKLSTEEFLSWQRLVQTHGVAGLRATRLQHYRNAGNAGGNGDNDAPEGR